MSGVYEKYMQFCSPYALHWHMLKHCIDNGFKRYNLYGISGIFDEVLQTMVFTYSKKASMEMSLN